MPQPPTNPPQRTLADRFADLIGAFQRALSQQSNARCLIAGALYLLIWNRLSGIRRRFADLAAKRAAGTLAAPRPPRARRQGKPRAPTPRPSNPFARQPGWLQRLVPEPWHVNYCQYPLQALLDDPELAALAAAAPQLGRLLRPLCRTINHPLPPFLQLPPRPRRPRPKPEPKPRPPRRVDINRMSAIAWGNFVHPERPGQHHPPTRIGYAAPRRRSKKPR